MFDNMDFRKWFSVKLFDGFGNPIKSFNGAVDVHDADVHSVPVNEHFHLHTGVSTTLAQPASAGDTSITVDSVIDFVAGNDIQIQDGVIETTFPKIKSIVGNVFNLDRPLDNDFAVGDIVDQVTINMNVIGTLASPVSFKVIPDANQAWHITTITLSLTHTGASDPSKFGDIVDGLANGVILRAYNASTGKYRTFTNWKTNDGIGLDFGKVDYIPKVGGGDNATFATANIKFISGAVPTINGVDGDYLEILIQDNLSSLLTVYAKVQGHIVGL